MDEANWPQQFDMEHFKSLRSFKARMEYCKANLPFIAGGSGRLVFKVDDQTVIKLAKNPKGVAQNEAEDNGYIQNHYDHIVTKVLENHPDHLWIESEMAKKITPSRFKQLTGGIDIKDVETWMHNQYMLIKGHGHPYHQNEEIAERIANDEFFSDLVYMARDVGMQFGDFGYISSYGELNGELRLVDYGLSDDVYSTHYERKPASVYREVVSRVMKRIIGS